MTKPFLLATLLFASLARISSAAGEYPGLPDLTTAQVDAYKKANATASKALETGDARKAVRSLKSALAIHDGNDGTWYNLACAQARAGLASDALTSLTTAASHGWNDAEWPTKDSDLAPLHALPAFQAWVQAVKSATPEKQIWPTPEPGSLAATEAKLSEHAEAWEARFWALVPVLGSFERSLATTELAAWKAASWDKFRAMRTDPVEEARAAYEALAAISGEDARHLYPVQAREAIRRAEGFVADNPADEHAASARLSAILAQLALDNSQAKGDPDRDAARRAFKSSLTLLAASHSEGSALEQALLLLIGESAADLPTAELLTSRLGSLLADADKLKERMTASYDTRGLYFRLRGLPQFTATMLEGTSVTPASLKGHVTLLDFWATWCGPCRAELPHLKEAWKRYRDQGFRIVGVSADKESDKNREAFLAWCKSNDVDWPQIYDGKGWDAELIKTFGVHGIPFALLLDADGKVIAADDQLRGDSLLDQIASAMALEAPPAVGGL